MSDRLAQSSQAADVRSVDAALKGSQVGFRELVERYQRPVFSIILRMVRDHGLAEDLAQEAFVKAFRALDSFDQSRKFSSWLFTIAHNTAIDSLRRKKIPTVPLETPGEERNIADLADVAAAPASETPEGVALRGDLLKAFETALSGLRPEYAEVLVLRFQEGLPYEEISEVTGLPLGTVKTHLHRARKNLAEKMGELGWAADERRRIG